MEKKTLYIAGSVGTAVGGYIPILFGADGLSIWSILGGGVGGILAITIVYKLSR
jgi:uncharacterized membrane protein YeaQ/YmgE (transglycosylase-associated protein family)